MKVLHLIDSLGRGGAERVVVTLAAVQQQSGPVAVATLGPGTDPLVAELEKRGVSVFPLALRSPKDLLRGVFRLRARLSRFRPDILHTHLLFSELQAASVPLLPGRPALVATFHNLGRAALPRESWKHSLVFGLESLALRRRFHALVAVSETARASYKKSLRIQDVSVIHNPVDFATINAVAAPAAGARQQLAVPAGSPIVVLIAKHTHEKAIDVALRAFARLPSGLARLVLVGDGPLGESLRHLSNELGLGSRLIWVGEVDPRRALLWLCAADVVLLSSRSEGLPVSVLEAMALGRPLVATAVGGVGEVVTSGRTGLLVPPESPELLAQALRSVLETPALASSMGTMAEQVAKSEFGVERARRRYDGVYRQALERSRS